MSLNGEWRFRCYPTVDAVPADFSDPVGYAAKAKAKAKGQGQGQGQGGWDAIPVPADWQLQFDAQGQPKYDIPIYTNFRYPIPLHPPYLPRANPTGCYLREFDTPAAFLGARAGRRRLYVVFHGYSSALSVWVNGREVGYSQVGQVVGMRCSSSGGVAMGIAKQHAQAHPSIYLFIPPTHPPQYRTAASPPSSTSRSACTRPRARPTSSPCASSAGPTVRQGVACLDFFLKPKRAFWTMACLHAASSAHSPAFPARPSPATQFTNQLTNQPTNQPTTQPPPPPLADRVVPGGPGPLAPLGHRTRRGARLRRGRGPRRARHPRLHVRRPSVVIVFCSSRPSVHFDFDFDGMFTPYPHT